MPAPEDVQKGSRRSGCRDTGDHNSGCVALYRSWYVGAARPSGHCETWYGQAVGSVVTVQRFTQLVGGGVVVDRLVTRGGFRRCTAVMIACYRLG